MRGTLVQVFIGLTIFLLSLTAHAGDQERLNDFEQEVLADFADDQRRDDRIRLEQESRQMMESLVENKNNRGRKPARDDDMIVTVRYVKR